MDMAVDGYTNDIHEVHTEAVPVGPENPYGNAFRAVATHLRRERGGPTADRPPERAVLAGLELRALQRGGRSGRLQANPWGERAAVLGLQSSSNLKRAGFVTKHLWATPVCAARALPGGRLS